MKQNYQEPKIILQPIMTERVMLSGSGDDLNLDFEQETD